MFDQPVDMVDVSLRMSNLMSQERERKKPNLVWLGCKKVFFVYVIYVHSLFVYN